MQVSSIRHEVATLRFCFVACTTISGKVADNLAIEFGVINRDTKLFHDLFKITERNRIAQVKKDRIQGHIFGVMGTFKIDQSSRHQS